MLSDHTVLGPKSSAPLAHLRHERVKGQHDVQHMHGHKNKERARRDKHCSSQDSVFFQEHHGQRDEDHKRGHRVKEVRRLYGIIHGQPHSECDDSRYVETEQHRKETHAGAMYRTCVE